VAATSAGPRIDPDKYAPSTTAKLKRVRRVRPVAETPPEIWLADEPTTLDTDYSNEEKQMFAGLAVVALIVGFVLGKLL
jgi:hypothetical protein